MLLHNNKKQVLIIHAGANIVIAFLNKNDIAKALPWEEMIKEYADKKYRNEVF